MPGYFTVTVSITPVIALTKVQAEGKTIVKSFGGFKGTVDLEYSCEAVSGGVDPSLSRYSDQVFLDGNVDAEESITIHGDTNQTVEFTAEGTAAIDGSDIDTVQGSLGS